LRNKNWIAFEVVIAVHESQLAEHGGAPGLRDRALLESALHRPRNQESYASNEPSIPELAATYALGIIKNHPFIDGNKRVGLVLLELFLELNAYKLTAPDDACYKVIVGAASGVLTDAELIGWTVQHSKPTISPAESGAP